MKLTKNDKIKHVSTMRKLKSATRPSARQDNNIKSSHGTGMPSSASGLKYSKENEAFAFQKRPPSSITGLSYKGKITVPIKLTILPTEERIVVSVDTADTESDWLSKEDTTTEDDVQKSSQSNDKADSSSPHGKPKVNQEHEGPRRHAGTSAMPQHRVTVHPRMKASSGLRWKAAYDHVRLDDSKKGKHLKYKKKKSQSEDEEPEDSSSPEAIVGGIFAGILVLWLMLNCVPRIW